MFKGQANLTRQRIANALADIFRITQGNRFARRRLKVDAHGKGDAAGALAEIIQFLQQNDAIHRLTEKAGAGQQANGQHNPNQGQERQRWPVG